MSWLRILTAVLTVVAAALRGAARRGRAVARAGRRIREPTYVTSDSADPDRVFVVERSGTIELVQDGSSTEFLDIDPAFGRKALDFGRMRSQLLAAGDAVLALGSLPREQIAGSYLRYREQLAQGAPTCPAEDYPQFAPAPGE